MKVKFPALRGQMGNRIYYSMMVKLNAVERMFSFKDWIEFRPEDREQRVLQTKWIPQISKYIVDNEDGYLFSSITASYKGEVEFEAIGNDGLGMLCMDLQDAQFVINDGQHRCAAIRQAIRDNPKLGDEAISVLLFPYENLTRVQQMFSDLNRNVHKTSKSLDILYDNRDEQSQVVKALVERVPAFESMVDKDAISLPARSGKLFTLSSLYDATRELLEGTDDLSQPARIEKAADYWTAVSEAIPEWLKVKGGELKAVEFRQERISSHTVVMRALGSIGAELMKLEDWRERVSGLGQINWRKNNPDWQNVCIIANSVVSNRQSRNATKAYIKRKLGLELTDAEHRVLETAQGGTPVGAAQGE